MIDIEIVRDPYDSAVRFGDATPFRPYIHKLYTPPWLDSYRLACGRKDLFAYIHERTDNMVLAVWYYPPGKPHPIGLMTELEVAEPVVPKPARGWSGGRWVPPTKEYMRARTRPLEEQFAAMQRKEESARRAEIARLHENKADRKEAARYLRNRGFSKEAYDIENYHTPFERPDSDLGTLDEVAP